MTLKFNQSPASFQSIRSQAGMQVPQAVLAHHGPRSSRPPSAYAATKRYAAFSLLQPAFSHVHSQPGDMQTRLKQGVEGLCVCGYACHRGDDETWRVLGPLLRCRFLRAYSNSVSGHVHGLKPPVSANVLVVGPGTDFPSRDLASANQKHRVTQVPDAGPKAGS